MIRKVTYALLALPVVLAISACGDPEAQQEEQLETATLDEPGLEDTSVTPDEAQSEALTLAAHLASGELDNAEVATTLEDLDRLITANIVEFPEDIRPGLTGDLESAHAALTAEDMGALQEAATSIENRLTEAAPASDEASASDAE
tara:strand:+ start:54038 stop:54475 length:438 start_codon:yes stop_codon:yes gene_type:complete